MTPRIHVPQLLQQHARIALDDHERHRLLRTLRLHVGDAIILFNGDSGAWQARIVETGPPLQVELVARIPDARDAALAVTLILGLTKSGAIELAVQKAVECGVARLIPLLTRYGVSRPDARQSENKSRRLQRIVIEAAQQCGRTRVPEILEPATWHDLPGLLDPGPRLLFWEEAEDVQAVRLRTLPHPGAAVTLLIGPEGGLTAEEVTHAQEQMGFVTVSLGPRILRAETAAMVTVAACQLLWGDMG
ncbi:MAG: 16S rRNA (uracil(1498)-N(3))-methyltransferase [Magnetococcales bacterium]|nr:16S rRNA (uracil(1498)-N(3))-methyltransferase [Magnetococcales bacterium]NGZ04862.1 16S rRNA (uracil(1498)-N(3))-methyltransferase [Magnetococcales bacterium]